MVTGRIVGLVSSVGRAPDLQAGVAGFSPAWCIFYSLYLTLESTLFTTTKYFMKQLH